MRTALRLLARLVCWVVIGVAAFFGTVAVVAMGAAVLLQPPTGLLAGLALGRAFAASGGHARARMVVA